MEVNNTSTNLSNPEFFPLRSFKVFFGSLRSDEPPAAESAMANLIGA